MSPPAILLPPTRSDIRDYKRVCDFNIFVQKMNELVSRLYAHLGLFLQAFSVIPGYLRRRWESGRLKYKLNT